MKHIIRTSTAVLLAGLAVAGCKTSPPASEAMTADTALTNAGQAIDHAAADPHVAKYASSELDRANDSLQKAKEAWSKKHDLSATTHLAYVAQQRAATAQELANGRAADDAVMVAAANRDHAVQVAAAERNANPTALVTTTQVQEGALAGFASGASKLPTKALPMIGELAAELKHNPNAKVVIEGHTDNVGDPKFNQNLALERAQAVRSALVRQGVDINRISIRSAGEENPIANNDTSTGRRQNRRAQVIIGDTETRMVGSSQGQTSATSSGEGEQSGQNVHSGQNTENGQTGQNEQNEQNGQDNQREP